MHCKHNIYNEFDYQSDISRWHRVRRVPTFLVFVEGALVDNMMLPDSRGRASGPSRQVWQLLRRLASLLQLHLV